MLTEVLKQFKKKAELQNSETYKKIREFQLDNIVALSNTQINPLILQGMLKNIYDTDNWESDYNKKRKGVN